MTGYVPPWYDDVLPAVPELGVDVPVVTLFNTETVFLAMTRFSAY
jgi:hypothetical protein